MALISAASVVFATSRVDDVLTLMVVVAMAVVVRPMACTVFLMDRVLFQALAVQSAFTMSKAMV